MKLNQPLAYKKRIPQEYACVNVLECEGKTWHVRQAGIPLDEWEKEHLF